MSLTEAEQVDVSPTGTDSRERRARSLIAMCATLVGAAILALALWFLRTPRQVAHAWRAEPEATRSPAAEEPERQARDADSTRASAAEAPTGAMDPAIDEGQHGMQLWFRVVSDESGRAVRGASITLNVRDAMVVSRADSEGFARLSLPVGDDSGAVGYAAVVTATNHAMCLVIVDANHETRERAIVVRLPAGACLIVDARDPNGRPLPGATLRVSVHGSELCSVQREGDRIPLGRRVVLRRDPLTRAVRRTGDLGWHDWSARLGDDGLAQLCDLPAGVELSCVVTVAGTNYVSAPETLLVGERREWNWTQPSPARLTGVLVDEWGAPVAAADVALAAVDKGSNRLTFLSEFDSVVAVATTDSAGAFSFEHAPPGELACGPLPGRWQLGSMAAVRVQLAAHSEHEPVRLVCHRSSFIQGRLTSAIAGRTPELVSVRLRRPDVDGEVVFPCRVDDWFSVGPLVPGVYYVAAVGSEITIPPDVHLVTGDTAARIVIGSAR
jgi:hypothetical protein